ncbi:YggL family protein [Vibrio natriegens]|uniref:YggL 50S ribosome-binding family protein n=1 Tax=Vibrio natriegens TaxID=691 RepID=UPI001EFC7C61|nr:50S ribosome-binding protein YggL [Vibrio natriegens]MCG9699850.1 YggL family protein [Vibrio natriegens]
MKLEKIDNKSRRIRKKLFLGEFAILGFEISCETDINDFDRYDVFVDDFVDYIDGLSLCFGGGGLELFEGFLCSTERYGNATEEQKAQVLAWLEARPEVKTAKAGELVDANYL